MEEPTQEQLLNYISAAMTFYKRVKGRGRAPTNKQIQAMLAACDVRVALGRIETNREIIQELEREETPPGDEQPWNPDFTTWAEGK
jgi:hypothetical protein